MTGAPPNPRAPAWLFAALAALTLPLVVSDRSLAYDDHLEPAVLLAEGGALPAPDACWECHQPPLYYALEAAAFTLSGAHSPSGRLAVARALSWLLAASLWGVAWALARRVRSSPGERLAATLFFVTLPACFLLHATLSNDVAAVALSGWLFAWLARAVDPERPAPSAAGWGAAGLLAGLAVLAKTTALPGVVVLAAAAWSRGAGQASRGGRAGSACAALAGAALAVGPWLARNLAVSGRLMPLRMQTQAYTPPDPGYFTSFRFLDLLAEPFAAAPGDTFLTHLDRPGPVDGSWLTRLYSLFFHESLGYLPPLWPWLVAALYAVGLIVVLLVVAGAIEALRRPRPDRLDRLALLFAALAFALLASFNAAYPSRLLVHGKAVFVMPAWPALFVLYARGVGAASEWGGRRAAPAVLCAHLTIQALFVAHAFAVVASLVLS